MADYGRGGRARSRAMSKRWAGNMVHKHKGARGTAMSRRWTGDIAGEREAPLYQMKSCERVARVQATAILTRRAGDVVSKLKTVSWERDAQAQRSTRHCRVETVDWGHRGRARGATISKRGAMDVVYKHKAPLYQRVRLGTWCASARHYHVETAGWGRGVRAAAVSKGGARTVVHERGASLCSKRRAMDVVATETRDDTNSPVHTGLLLEILLLHFYVHVELVPCCILSASWRTAARDGGGLQYKCWLSKVSKWSATSRAINFEKPEKVTHVWAILCVFEIPTMSHSLTGRPRNIEADNREPETDLATLVNVLLHRHSLLPPTILTWRGFALTHLILNPVILIIRRGLRSSTPDMTGFHALPSHPQSHLFPMTGLALIHTITNAIVWTQRGFSLSRSGPSSIISTYWGRALALTALNSIPKRRVLHSRTPSAAPSFRD
ncbi:hypothetical protein EW146_g4701 [Bondarzewia mesenterica]|uniref:Uncharacterized protein n=1 Tax=Bondarzewia mesenterica TaxID=1095465 RepID=A0A4S4LUA0_9AGAM|nr:hypothetical protein EW146_g4701 [Bondarzewia mesenterica]